MSAPRGGPGADAGPDLPTWLREVLRCPATRGPLQDVRDDDGRLVGLLSTSAEPPLLYPVVDGVPVLLVDEAVPQPAGEPTQEPSAGGAPGDGPVGG